MARYMQEMIASRPCHVPDRCLLWRVWDKTRDKGSHLPVKNTQEEFGAHFDVTLTRADSCSLHTLTIPHQYTCVFIISWQ
eukprot:scaffold177361_cov103-Cyclotella_meneghiniana.AAC.1